MHFANNHRYPVSCGLFFAATSNSAHELVLSEGSSVDKLRLLNVRARYCHATVVTDDSFCRTLTIATSLLSPLWSIQDNILVCTNERRATAGRKQ